MRKIKSNIVCGNSTKECRDNIFSWLDTHNVDIISMDTVYNYDTKQYECMILYKSKNHYKVVISEDTKELINDYLYNMNVGDRVCARMLINNVLGSLRDKSDKLSENRQVGQILNDNKDWVYRENSRHDFGKPYGRQRYWIKVSNNIENKFEDLN